ncbi:MAG: hypothetical protein ACLUTK_02160, partial [[Clostridium] leptum]
RAGDKISAGKLPALIYFLESLCEKHRTAVFFRTRGRLPSSAPRHPSRALFILGKLRVSPRPEQRRCLSADGEALRHSSGV